ncbi:hypothetical protein [Ideonella sp. YS5]|uniref:hypothetical protein n=1 Tax=Ideonella sp. YS5 TaxID=3453714 RepID=UPI003F71DDCE
MGWAIVTFTFAFSFLGSMGKGTLPPLFKHLLKLEEVAIDGTKPRAIRVLIKLALLYFTPVAMLYLMSIGIAGLYFGDDDGRFALFPLLVFSAAFASALIPLSVVIGKGKQGIHDVVAGLSVVSAGTTAEYSRQTAPLLWKSVAVAAAVALAATIVLLSVFAKAHATHRPIYIGDELKSRVARYDAMFPGLPQDCRKHFSSATFWWWLDLGCGTAAQEDVGRSLGLEPWERQLLLGIGFREYRYPISIPLISLDRKSTVEIAAEAPMIAITVFTEAALFHYPERRRMLQQHILERALRQGLLTDFRAGKFKFVRMIKVAFLTITVYDEYIVMNDRVWRQDFNLGPQYTFRFNFAGAFSGEYITNFEIE